MRKVIRNIIIFTALLLLTGCLSKEPHASGELEKAITELECTSPSGKCDLEDKYTIIGEQYDEEKNEKRLNVKLKDYDINFDMISRYRMWGGCDGPCDKGYAIETNYYSNVFKYYYDNFSKENSIDLCEIHEMEYEDIVLKCNINTKDDIKIFSDFFSKFVDYLNSNKNDLYFAKDKKVITITVDVPKNDILYSFNTLYPYASIDFYIRANKRKKYSMSLSKVSIHDKQGNSLYCNGVDDIYDLYKEITHIRICKENKKISNIFKYLSHINNKYDLVQ